MSDKNEYIKLYRTLQLQLPVFMQPWWLDALCDEWDVVMSYKGSNVSGAWTYHVEAGRVVNPFFTPYLGPHIFYPHNIKDNNRDDYQYEAVAELIKKIPETKKWKLSIDPGIKQPGIFNSYGLASLAGQTFRVPLDGGEQDLLENMEEGVRNDILKASEQFVVTSNREQLDKMINAPGTRLVQKIILQNLQKGVNASMERSAGELWTVMNGTEFLAMAWHVWDGTGSYFLNGGKSNDADGSAAMSLLMWHMLKEASSRRHTFLDLMGGLHMYGEQFFRDLGAEKVLYTTLQKK